MSNFLLLLLVADVAVRSSRVNRVSVVPEHFQSGCLFRPFDRSFNLEFIAVLSLSLSLGFVNPSTQLRSHSQLQTILAKTYRRTRRRAPRLMWTRESIVQPLFVVEVPVNVLAEIRI